MSIDVLGDFIEWICPNCGKKHIYLCYNENHDFIRFVPENKECQISEINVTTVECKCHACLDLANPKVIELFTNDLKNDSNQKKLERIQGILRE